MTSKDKPLMSTAELEALGTRLFTPNLKPPRMIRFPSPPSLAGSKLPPPCAETDERSTWRVRRFRLWRDNVPPLRVAVLDPRRRGEYLLAPFDQLPHTLMDSHPAHLRRYQAFANPTTTAYVRGVQAWKYTPPRRAAPPHRPIVMPRTPYPGNPDIKVHKWERKARYQRILQYKYALDQEHERRFRKGMTLLLPYVLDFERSLSDQDGLVPDDGSGPPLDVDTVVGL